MAGPASERDSDVRNPPSSTVKEHEVRDSLSRRLGATIEVPTPSGSIDVLSKNEVIEVKHYRAWKNAIGQVIAYSFYYPSHKKRVHLFAQKGDKMASKYVQLATPVCSTYGIDVTFEEVSHEMCRVPVKKSGCAIVSEANLTRERVCKRPTKYNKHVTRNENPGGCPAPGLEEMQMGSVSSDGESGSKGTKRSASEIDKEARRKELPEKAPKQEHEYTDNHRRKQENKRSHLRRMNVIFNMLARERVRDVSRSFMTGSLEHKLNREKGLPGCLFLPPIWEELCQLDKDVCDGFRVVFGAKKALYDFEQNHPAFYEWHLWHETDG